MSLRRSVKAVVAALIALCAFSAPASAQITTGAVTGTVVDAQGGVIPGATVVLISETQGTKSTPAVTNGQGQYTVPNMRADTYTVEVTMPSFKPISRKGVKVSGGDRVTVEALTLQVGGATETVTVQAEAPTIQSATGERSQALQMVQLDNLPVSSHNFLNFVTTTVGINSGTLNSGQNQGRIGGGGQDNIMLDGISALDTGNNGLMGGMNLPEQAIVEIKVLTSGYQAEYGRSSGLQISAVTRGGTNQFHGGFYDYERRSDWNSNSWANKLNGNAKAFSKQRDWGYTVGGPVGKPGRANKLFFFYTHEFRPRTSTPGNNNFRMPTALERQGDFSQTLDNNGALYNFIYDPTTGQPKANCSATIQTACFADGGVLGRIPKNRLYGPGMAILNEWPMPNVAQAAASSFNYSITPPVQDTLGYTPVIRLDSQIMDKLRVTWKSNAASSRIVPNLGNLPGYTDQLQKFPLSINTASTVNYSLSQSTFLEATYGFNQNRLGTPSISPFSDRRNIKCPADLAAQVANCTGAGFTFLFPNAGIMDPSYYETKALAQVGSPFFDNGTTYLPPNINWGTTRLSGAPPSIGFPGFMNINTIQQANISVTRVMGRHTAKAGLYIEHSYKAQNTGGQLSFQGALNLGVDTNNPLDSQMAFSNAALGVFSTFAQGSKFIEGSFHYNNIEWFLQDNWKVNRKLTLDYGVRFAHDQPYIDGLKQVANFFPDKWTLAAAPTLYVAGCVGNVNPCSGNNRQAKDPRTGALLGVNTTSLIGTVIVGSGNFANGMIRGGDGIADGGYTWPTLVAAPRFGAAYDVTGRQKLVLRGSVGLYFDRPDGNTAFGTVANPPVATGLTQQWGRLADLSSASLAFGPVPNIVANQYDSAIPKDVQWNGGVQIALPWASSVDVSYVGHHQFDALAGTQNGNQTNYNAIDVGTTLTAAGIDATLAPPAAGITPTAVNTNLLRAYRGYGAINIQTSRWQRTFHSIQTTFTRRFSHGISFGFADTWTLSDKGNVQLPGPQLRLIHAADGSFSISPDQAIAEDLFGNQGVTTHVAVGNFVWDLPDLKHENKMLKALGLVINDWQFSGIFRADSGTPYDVGYSYNTGNNGQALTGSPDYTPRIVITNLGALGSGCSSDQFQQINNTLVPVSTGLGNGAGIVLASTAVAGPQIGSHGLESGRNLLHSCKDHKLDLAIQRTIRINGGKQSVSLRADLYNALNTVIISARQSTFQMNSTGDFSIRNPQFLADGKTLDPARVRPNQAGFGAATGADALRSVQGQIKFTF